MRMRAYLGAFLPGRSLWDNLEILLIALACLLRRWLSVINTNCHVHQSLVIEDVLSIDDLVHWLSIININCHGLTLRLELCIVLSCLCFLVWTAHGQRTRLAPTHVPPRWQVLTVTFAVVLSTR